MEVYPIPKEKWMEESRKLIYEDLQKKMDEPLYAVTNKEEEEVIYVELKDQGGLIKIKMESDGISVEAWAQTFWDFLKRTEDSEYKTKSMFVSYDELRGE